MYLHLEESKLKIIRLDIKFYVKNFGVNYLKYFTMFV